VSLIADNVTVDNVDLTDYVVATDDDGTAQHQYVKLEFGADNTQTKVSASNPLPITGTALWGTVTVGSSLPAGTNTLGTVAIAGSLSTSGTVALIGSLPAGANFLGTIANAGTVAVSSLVAALPAGTNTLGTVALVGALPSGNAFLGTIANAGTVAVSSVVAALPAGTNTIGTVALAGSLSTAGTVALIGALPAGSNFLGTIANAGTVAVSSLVTSLPAGTNTIGTVAISGSLSTSGTVAGIGTFTTKETRSSTGTLSHISPSMTVVGLLNTNSSRLGFSVQNDATGNLYLALNSNASTTDYTARLTQYSYYEVPFNYTGTVTGLWSTVVASDGAARITEFS
jgi:hypothetical protein